LANPITIEGQEDNTREKREGITGMKGVTRESMETKGTIVTTTEKGKSQSTLT